MVFIMPFSNDRYHSKAYKHLERLEVIYSDLCYMSGILSFKDNVFLPSGDIDIDKSILKVTKQNEDHIKFMKSESKL